MIVHKIFQDLASLQGPLYQSTYSAGQKKHYKYFFMKQKFQLQIGIARYRNVAASTKGIITTHLDFQMR